MHRVFQPPANASTDGPGAALAGLRAFLCALGLVEQPAGDAFCYVIERAGRRSRLFATLHGGRRSATVYLYPDALGRGPGVATAFYRRLDDAGLGMGSKAGPSIGIDLDDLDQVRLFREGLQALLGE